MLLRSLSGLLLLCCTPVCLLPEAVCTSAVPSASKSLVWGLGLEANAVLPARFFFIQSVDKAGKNLTTSPGANTFEVKVTSPSEAFSRIWVQVLDRQDGSFLVRYRMYASYTELNVEILLKNKHVAKSPYILKGPVYHESCNCPEPSGALWMNHMHCPSSFSQIQHDLSIFPKVDLERNAHEIPQRFGQRQSLCHYTIKNNQASYAISGRCISKPMASMLASGSSWMPSSSRSHGKYVPSDTLVDKDETKVRLPDVEFFVNLGDWPLEKRRTTDKLHPIFSWCGSNDTRDIVMPTYDLTESVLETMGRVSLDMMSVQANTGPPWAEKNMTAFWRGRDSRRERLELVKLARANPELLDAAFTNFFFFEHVESLYGPLVKHVSFFDFFKYKYQINVDGTVAAYRMPYLLAGDSVVLKQDSTYYEHFYSQLQPWVHYIPIKADLSDVLEKIQWAKEHDEEEYEKLQVTEPKIRDGMELVEQPKDDLFPCYCHRTKVKDEL
ncbi:KDEL motif-containing protein 1 precursor [Silurus meridionalis]|nr:KDEL motif-containing protein 1 precursor [Silurus meridionalis]